MRRVVVAALALILAGQSLAEPIFIDKDVCPGEGCRYGEQWVARTAVVLRATPDANATPVAMLKPGDSVSTLTGEVHTIPGRFIVQRPSDGFSPGDEILVFTYLGEGHFRIRHNGQPKVANLHFSPWGGTPGKRCELSSRCWGTLERELEFDWWVKVRTSGGTEAWVLGGDDFGQPIDD